jgi:NADH-quinone oxidoreductase subunit L
VLYVARHTRPVEDNQPRGFFENLVYHKYYVDELYDALFVKPSMFLSRGFHDVVEKRVVDGAVNGIGRGVMGGSQLLRYIQSGTIGTYLLLMVLGIVVILALNFVRL